LAARLRHRSGALETPFPALPIDIEELIARLARRDVRAFATFYDRTAGFVFGLVLRILHDRDAAEEVVQEVYLQLWRSAGSFDARRSSGLAWVAMVARSRAIDRLRADASRRNVLQELGREPATAGHPDPEEEAELSELRVKVTKALEALPQEQRRALELAYFGGLSHSEIARETGTPLGTVKTRIRAAIDKLEQLLDSLRS
jgi:RNA polymerase sigma-70 factor (ECF subfamily)